MATSELDKLTVKVCINPHIYHLVCVCVSPQCGCENTRKHSAEIFFAFFSSKLQR